MKYVARTLAQRIEAYLDDAPSCGGHSDLAGGSAYDLLRDTLEDLNAPAAADSNDGSRTLPEAEEQIERLNSRVAELLRERDALREALEPFAKIAEFVSADHRDTRPIIHGLCVSLAERLTIGDLRKARAALGAKP